MVNQTVRPEEMPSTSTAAPAEAFDEQTTENESSVRFSIEIYLFSSLVVCICARPFVPKRFYMLLSMRLCDCVKYHFLPLNTQIY